MNSRPANISKLPPEIDRMGEQKLVNDSTYVGYATLSDQVFRRSVKRGFEFNLMVAGKQFFIILSTDILFNTLFY